jgi:hypothetical protein
LANAAFSQHVENSAESVRNLSIRRPKLLQGEGRNFRLGIALLVERVAALHKARLQRLTEL